MDMPQHTTDFIPRVNEEDELSYDPETLTPKKPRPQPQVAGPPAQLPSEVQQTGDAEAKPAAPITVAAPIAADNTPQQQLCQQPKNGGTDQAIELSREPPDVPEEEEEEELEYEVSRIRGGF